MRERDLRRKLEETPGCSMSWQRPAKYRERRCLRQSWSRRPVWLARLKIVCGGARRQFRAMEPGHRIEGARASFAVAVKGKAMAKVTAVCFGGGDLTAVIEPKRLVRKISNFDVRTA
jgi:hypothetical protein